MSSGVSIPVSNKFDVLAVEPTCPLEVDSNADRFEVAPACKSCVKRICKGCSKVLVNGNTSHCSKCKNTSFEHLKND